MKFWIARDNPIIPEDMEHFVEEYPEKAIIYTKLHIFYDKPIWNGESWECARKMCKIENYMFPEIKCGECIEFNSSNEKVIK